MNQRSRKVLIVSLATGTTVTIVALLAMPGRNPPRRPHLPAGVILREASQMPPPQYRPQKPFTAPATPMNAPAGASASSGVAAEINSLVAHMAEIKRCSEEGTCPFPETDPRAAYFAAGDAIKADLGKLLELQKREGDPDPAIQKAAREYLAYENDNVRDAALKILAAVPPDPENLSAIFSGLQESHDAILFRSAMDEFKRYDDSDSRSRISDYLLQTIESGSYFVSQATAGQVLPFLTPSNAGVFRALLDRLPADSPRTALLRKSLDDFDRLQNGG